MSLVSDQIKQGPVHHPDAALLLDYASGSLREPVSLVIATHLALCPQCRGAVSRLESAGGVMLARLAPSAMSPGSLGRTLAKLDDEPAMEDRSAPPAPAGDIRIPRPLRDYLAALPCREGGGWNGLPWQKRFKGFAEIALLPESSGFRTRLLRIAGGASMPAHTHLGTEITLVLAGGFSDASGQYSAGDVAEADGSVTHKPVADPGEDCICIAVTDAPLKLTGGFGRLLNPFIQD